MATGGARPNSGPKKGTKYKPRKISPPKDVVGPDAMATGRNIAELTHSTKRTPDQRRSKDLLAEGARFMFSCMSQVGPTKALVDVQLEDGTMVKREELVWRRSQDRELFFAFADRMGLFAARAAPFEDPTYRAIAIVSQGSDKPALTLEQVSNVLQLDDQQGTSRVYAQMVKATRAA